MQHTPGTSSGMKPASMSSRRPEGVGITALLMSLFLAIDYISSLIELSGGSLAELFTHAHAYRLIGGPFVVAVVYFVIWSYYQGENWSRILVLVWSGLVAIEGVSIIWEHGGNLTSAMAHPILFLKCVLAGFLLYWLNTREVRVYFQGTPTAINQLGQHLSGRLCTSVESYASAPDSVGWRVAFEHGAELFLDCPWRIVVDGNLSWASNAGAEVTPEIHPRQLLQNVRVASVRVAPGTADLVVAFEMGIELQTWSIDSIAPQWKYSDPGLTVAAQGASPKSDAIVSEVSGESTGDHD